MNITLSLSLSRLFCGDGVESLGERVCVVCLHNMKICSTRQSCLCHCKKCAWQHRSLQCTHWAQKFRCNGYIAFIHSWIKKVSMLGCFRLSDKKVLLTKFKCWAKVTIGSKEKPVSNVVFYLYSYLIEEGFIQKARQTVVVSVWGARSYAALGIFVLYVYSIVHAAVVLFPLLLWGGDTLCRFVFQV